MCTFTINLFVCMAFIYLAEYVCLKPVVNREILINKSEKISHYHLYLKKKKYDVD